MQHTAFEYPDISFRATNTVFGYRKAVKSVTMRVTTLCNLRKDKDPAHISRNEKADIQVTNKHERCT